MGFSATNRHMHETGSRQVWHAHTHRNQQLACGSGRVPTHIGTSNLHAAQSACRRRLRLGNRRGRRGSRLSYLTRSCACCMTPGAMGVRLPAAARILLRPSGGGRGTNSTCSNTTEQHGRAKHWFVRAPRDTYPSTNACKVHTSCNLWGLVVVLMPFLRFDAAKQVNADIQSLCGQLSTLAHLVQPARPEQCRVDHVRPIGGSNHIHTLKHSTAQQDRTEQV